MRWAGCGACDQAEAGILEQAEAILRRRFERMARGAWAAAVAAIRKGAGSHARRWQAQYRADDGQGQPIAVIMQRSRAFADGAIPAMLDGE